MLCPPENPLSFGQVKTADNANPVKPAQQETWKPIRINGVAVPIWQKQPKQGLMAIVLPTDTDMG